MTSSVRAIPFADKQYDAAGVQDQQKDDAAVRLGRKGGRATAKKLSQEQRKERARKAAKARWSKRKPPE
jgi:hypothetical protein